MKTYQLKTLYMALHYNRIKKEKIPFAKALIAVNEFMDELHGLSIISYKEGLDKFSLLDKKIKIFIERVFPKESEKRMKEYDKDVHRKGRIWIVSDSSSIETDADKQRNYLTMLKKAHILLQAWEDELLRYADLIEIGKIVDVKVEKETGWKLSVPKIIEKWSKTKERK
jgi:hypothetical protein